MVLVYPNQKIVTVHKAPANKDNVYGVLNKKAAFSAMQNLTHNEMKVFIYLSLNQSEYCMALSTADAAAKVGSTEDGMRKAVQGLIKKGYLVQNHGREYDFYEDPELALPKKQKKNNKNLAVSCTENSDSTNAKSSVCKAQIEGEIIKENTVENTIDYIHEDLQDDSSNWDLIFQRINVKCFAHTMKRLEEAAGCKLDWRVVKRIVSQNWPAFEKGMSEREGYRLSTLAHLISSQYGKWEQEILLEDADSKRTTGQKRNKPRIDYDALERTESKQEGLGDISEWLDMFDDVI